jgi:hypothetical protein
MMCRRCRRNARWIGVVLHRRDIKTPQANDPDRLCRYAASMNARMMPSRFPTCSRACSGAFLRGASHAAVSVYCFCCRPSPQCRRLAGAVFQLLLGRAGRAVPAGRSLHARSRTEMARKAPCRPRLRRRDVNSRRSSGAHSAPRAFTFIVKPGSSAAAAFITQASVGSDRRDPARRSPQARSRPPPSPRRPVRRWAGGCSGG